MQTSSLQVQAPAASPTFRNVLLATDFSPASRAAFHAALEVCKVFAAKLTILHVFEYADELPLPDGDELLDMQRPLLEVARSCLHALGSEALHSGLECEVNLRAGDSTDTIRDFILAEPIDLAILGTNALHGFERLVFGSTAEAVLRRSSVPVLTVGPQAATDLLAREDRPIVFATDFHATTVQAIQLAATVSNVTLAPLHCLHVLPRSLQTGPQCAIIPGILTEALQQVASSTVSLTHDPVCATTYGSEVSNAVVDYARRQHAKLVVLGIRQASLAVAHTPAHIAYRIITEAPCPVLTMAFGSNSGRTIRLTDA